MSVTKGEMSLASSLGIWWAFFGILTRDISCWLSQVLPVHECPTGNAPFQSGKKRNDYAVCTPRICELMAATDWFWFFGANSRGKAPTLHRHDSCNQFSGNRSPQVYCWLNTINSLRKTGNVLVWSGTTSPNDQRTWSDTENILVWTGTKRGRDQEWDGEISKFLLRILDQVRGKLGVLSENL